MFIAQTLPYTMTEKMEWLAVLAIVILLLVFVVAPFVSKIEEFNMWRKTTKKNKV